MGMILFFAVNILLILNMAKIYAFSWADDRLRLICYSVIILCMIVAFLINLFKSHGIIRTTNLVTASLIFTIIVFSNLYFRNNTDVGDWLYRLLVLVTLFASLGCFQQYYELPKIIRIEVIIIAIATIIYIYSRFTVRQAGSEVLNSVFYCVLMIPFLLTSDNLKVVDALFSLIAFASIISLKRTAIIIVAFSLFIYYKKRDKQSRNQVLKLLSLFIFSALVVLYVQAKLGIDILGRIGRSIEDGGSGRTDIYSALLKNIFKMDLRSLLFGGGFDAVINVVGGSSHNDFIEVFYCYGLIGFVPYIAIHVELVKIEVKMKRNNYRYADQFMISILAFFIMSMLSQVINLPTYFLSIVLYWGVIINDFSKCIVE